MIQKLTCTHCTAPKKHQSAAMSKYLLCFSAGFTLLFRSFRIGTHIRLLFLLTQLAPHLTSLSIPLNPRPPPPPSSFSISLYLPIPPSFSPYVLPLSICHSPPSVLPKPPPPTTTFPPLSLPHPCVPRPSQLPTLPPCCTPRCENFNPGLGPAERPARPGRSPGPPCAAATRAARDITRFSPRIDLIFPGEALNPFFGAQDEGFSEFRSR